MTLYVYAECHYTERQNLIRYTECRYAECRYVVWPRLILAGEASALTTWSKL
jgi:hypothetical protein